MACPLRSESEKKLLLEEPTPQMTRDLVKKIKGVGGQFIEDVDVIIDKCESKHFVIMVLSELVRELLRFFYHHFIS